MTVASTPASAASRAAVLPSAAYSIWLHGQSFVAIQALAPAMPRFEPAGNAQRSLWSLACVFCSFACTQWCVITRPGERRLYEKTVAPAREPQPRRSATRSIASCVPTQEHGRDRSRVCREGVPPAKAALYRLSLRGRAGPGEKLLRLP